MKYVIAVLSIICVAVGTYILTLSENDELILQGEIDTTEVDLSSKIVGRVAHILAKEGDIVAKGQKLLVLDIPDIEAQRQQLEAAYNLALQTFNRIKTLKEKGFASVQSYDNAFATLKQAENKLREVQSYIDENTITAHISGQVKDISVEEGELVSAGYTIITLINTSDNWAVFNLREDLLAKIKLGSVFKVDIPAVGQKNIPFKVDYISAMGNYTTWRATKIRGDFDLKTFEIHARPLEPINGLIAGMSVIVDWNKVGQ